MPFDRDTLRAFADQYLPSAISEAHITSADKYYAWLQENELPVTRAIAREAWREYGRATSYADVLAIWPENNPIPRAWYGETTAKGVKSYKYNVDVQLYNVVTESPDKDTWYIYSETPLKKYQIEDYINQSIQESYSDIWNQVVDYRISATYHRTGAKW